DRVDEDHGGDDRGDAPHHGGDDPQDATHVAHAGHDPPGDGGPRPVPAAQAGSTATTSARWSDRGSRTASAGPTAASGPLTSTWSSWRTGASAGKVAAVAIPRSPP